MYEAVILKKVGSDRVALRQARPPGLIMKTNREEPRPDGRFVREDHVMQSNKRKNRTMRLTLALVGLSLAGTATAQSTPPKPLPDCSAPEHRQLDFWLGNWAVFNTADGVRYGRSRIETAALGCAIRETYESPKAPGGAYIGESYSSYDVSDRRWRQFYIGSHETITLFAGELRDGGIEFLAPMPNGGTQKMIYRPEPDGSIRQIGRISNDGGKTWKPAYDYTYRRVAPDGGDK
jgi:hypothetical protein